MALDLNHYEKGILDNFHFYETLLEMRPSPFKSIKDLQDILKMK